MKLESVFHWVLTTENILYTLFTMFFIIFAVGLVYLPFYIIKRIRRRKLSKELRAEYYAVFTQTRLTLSSPDSTPDQRRNAVDDLLLTSTRLLPKMEKIGDFDLAFEAIQALIVIEQAYMFNISLEIMKAAMQSKK